ncbi:hypothetical protein [Saccharothrix variisporea]|uniref:hypothetical protein n=1 Tax=Saccharothrix variisporea TaxID=543527 RepID=UPI000EABF8F8|nr:hypothetical protein [Saccharothrix variisporea]
MSTTACTTTTTMAGSTSISSPERRRSVMNSVSAVTGLSTAAVTRSGSSLAATARISSGWRIDRLHSGLVSSSCRWRARTSAARRARRWRRGMKAKATMNSPANTNGVTVLREEIEV